MKGFDKEFLNIADYILTITYRIWEGKNPQLCTKYYSKQCPVYTLAGITIGVDEVITNTKNTLVTFPNRSLTGVAVLSNLNNDNVYHSSHLIKSQMTNIGASEFGKATNKDADFWVIAHCKIKDNLIFEEWLVRDNYALVQQLGFDPNQIAITQAKKPMQPRLKQWLASETHRIKHRDKNSNLTNYSQLKIEQVIRNSLDAIWSMPKIVDLKQYYADSVRFESMANRKGMINAVLEFYNDFLETFSDIKLSIDYVTATEQNRNDVAVRWTMLAKHTGDKLYGKASAAEIFILGESHYQIVDAVILQEVTVFDELAILTQIYRARQDKIIIND